MTNEQMPSPIPEMPLVPLDATHLNQEAITRLETTQGPQAFLDNLDRVVRTSEEKTGEGVADKEEGRLQYETKTMVLKLIPSLLGTCGVLGTIYFLATGKIRNPVAEQQMINQQSLDMVWLFESNDSHFQGGQSILNILEQNRISGVDYDNRDTWGLQFLPGGIITGGNSFGIKAKMLVGWTDDLLTVSGREQLIKAAQKQNQGEGGAIKFDQKMRVEEVTAGRNLTWEETKTILQKEFGFDERYLSILTELRKEYYVGDGNLGQAIERAKIKGSREKHLIEKDQIQVADRLLQITGLERIVDAETAVAITEAFPIEATELHASAAIPEIFPDLISKPPVGIEATQVNTALMMAITLGYISKETPRFFNWAKNQLQSLAKKDKKIYIFLQKDKLN